MVQSLNVTLPFFPSVSNIVTSLLRVSLCPSSFFALNSCVALGTRATIKADECMALKMYLTEAGVVALA